MRFKLARYMASLEHRAAVGITLAGAAVAIFGERDRVVPCDTARAIRP